MVPIAPEGIAAILGLFLPPIVSLVNNPRWSGRVKLLVAGVASLAAGAFATWAGGDAVLTDPVSIFTSAAAAFSAATFVYKGWFEGAKVLGVAVNDKLSSFILL